MKIEAKPWNCTSCGNKIGDVLSGQLVFENAAGNTDDSNFVIRCPNCGAPKTWYSYDKLDRLIDAIAIRVVQRMR